jgi:hypothetical protein
VKTRFQSLPFKRNLQRYTPAQRSLEFRREAGLCTLNQVDP